MSERSSAQKVSIGLLVLTSFALVVGLFNAATSQVSSHEEATQQEEDSGISSLLSSGGIKKNHLLLVDLSGPIMMDGPQQGGGFLPSDSPAVSVRKALDKAAKDDSVKGVLLRINSPGGTVGMSQELHAAVQRVSKKKPIVASLGDITASGGYYTACATDKIMANPGTLTGSIGVIISGMNLKGLLTDKLGLKPLTIKSGKFKDILSPYRDARPEEVALIQNLIDDSYDQFLNAVIEGRTRFIPDAKQKKAIAAKISSIADGRVLIATEAKKMGLVDEIGDLYDAKKLLNTMAKERFNIKGKEELPLEEYSGSSLLEMLGITSRLNLAPAAGAEQTLNALVPFSARYPNQPLWIAE